MLAMMLAARVVFEPPAEVVIASERPEVIEPPVSLTLLGAAAGERVALYAAGEERPRVGRLVAFDGERVVLSQRDGMLAEIDRKSIVSVRVLPSPPAAVPVATTPACPTFECASDKHCDYPSQCIDGACLIDRAYIDALTEEGEAYRKGGRRTMIAAGVLALAGAVLVPVGVTVENNAGWATEDPNLARANRGQAVWVMGTVALGTSVVTVIVGSLVHHVGKWKLRRARKYRASGRMTD
jgi:hypothetical protein